MPQIIGEGTDLELSPEQRVALLGIQAVALALSAFRTNIGATLGLALEPSLAQATSAILSPTKCPYDHPPADIIQDFDSKKNMYLHCLHASTHCWNMSGHFVGCPK